MRRGLAASAFGSVRVRTPLLRCAVYPLDLDRERERQRAAELPLVEFPQVPLLALGVLPAVALRRDRQHAAIDVDLHVLLADPRQERRDPQLVVGATDVHREGLARGRATDQRAGMHDTPLHELGHRVAQA